jgi:phosphatidylinositol alpha-mannosyltransferase
LAESALGGSYTITFNGIEVDRFVRVEPWSKEGPTVLFVGRHEPRKGLAVLLDAMRLLPADVRLWVAGTGPETERLRSSPGADGRIEWLGRIGDREKAARLRAADVFCAPSLGGESFGVVLLEAMAAGTPVVASDLPGYRTVATDGVSAVLAPPNDARELAGAIARVLSEPGLAAALVAAGRDRADGFSMDRLARIYADIYAEVCALNAE